MRATADDLVVYVAGEVASPGLHELPAGAETGAETGAVGTWFLSRQVMQR